MSIAEIVRLTAGTVCIIAGLIVLIIEICGISKMKYVLNRMHAAAMGDTMGIFLMMLGACFYQGADFTSVKIALVVILFWIASPVSSHMTALLESYTNDKLNTHLSYEGDLKGLEDSIKKEKDK